MGSQRLPVAITILAMLGLLLLAPRLLSEHADPDVQPIELRPADETGGDQRRRRRSRPGPTPTPTRPAPPAATPAPPPPPPAATPAPAPPPPAEEDDGDADGEED